MPAETNSIEMRRKVTKKKLHYAWLILVGIILIRGFSGGGINMTSGLFLAPVSQDIGVGIGSLSIYFSITSIVMVLWLPSAGKLINKYDIRIVAAAGAVLQTFSFIAFGFMNNVYGWYLLAIPHAMGASILVQLLGPIMIHRWFAKNAGMMLGIQMAFVSLFGAVLQPVTSNLIARQGWRNAYYLIGGLTFVVVMLAALLLLRNKPQEKGILPYGEEALSAPGEKSAHKNNTVQEGHAAQTEEFFGVSEQTAVKSPSYILLLFFMIAITGVGVFTQHIPTYGTLMGYSIQSTGAALSFASIGSAIGSIAVGIVSDRIGSLKTCYGIIVIGILAVIGFLSSTAGFYVFGLSTFLHGLTNSGIMVLAPILTLRFYGQKDYEKIYAKVSMGAPLASILLIPAYGFIYDAMHDYFYVLIFMGVLLLFAAFCIAVGWKKRCTKEGCPGWKS